MSVHSKTTVGLLVSGELGLRLFKFLVNKYHLVCVLTDKKSQGIIDFAQKKNIKLFIGNPREGKATEFIENIQIDILLSVGYLFLVEKDLISWPKKYAINIHGSLLPKYRGRSPYLWVIINNEKFYGVTAHLIDEECDHGDILKQVTIPIRDNDTGYDLVQKYYQIYPKLVQEVLTFASKGKLKTRPQDNSQATYFGKRSPEDGKIDWNWQKERIYNLVRALAKPYSGAFTFYNGVKVIFNQSQFSDLGFSYDQANGLILKASKQKLFVKTPNGVVELSKWETSSKVNFRPGIVLG